MTKKQIQKVLSQLPLINSAKDLQDIKIYEQPIYKVVWIDAWAQATGWKDAIDHEECIIHTVGYALRLKTQLVLIPGSSLKTENITGQFSIPIDCIREILILSDESNGR